MRSVMVGSVHGEQKTIKASRNVSGSKTVNTKETKGRNGDQNRESQCCSKVTKRMRPLCSERPVRTNCLRIAFELRIK